MITRSRQRRLTASMLWRSFLCLGSAVLDAAPAINPWAERGSGVHAFFLDVNVRMGAGGDMAAARTAALAAIKGEDLRAVCAMFNLERLPLDPALYAAEVAFAFDVVSGKARELGRGINRGYPSDVPTEIYGTADGVALVGDDSVLIFDYKPGWKWLPDPAFQWQFRFLALAAARTYGRSRVVVQMIRFANGEPYMVTSELGIWDLVEIAEELRELHAEWTRWMAADEDPPLVTGEHCNGCESISNCNASTAMIRAFAGQPDVYIDGWAGSLTRPEHAAVALEQFKFLEKALEKMREQLESYATAHPIPMRDGRLWGPRDASRSHPTGVNALHYLIELVGEKRAWELVKVDTSWTKVEDIARDIAEKGGRKIKHVMAELREEFHSRGAVTVSNYPEYKAYKPPKETR